MCIIITTEWKKIEDFIETKKVLVECDASVKNSAIVAYLIATMIDERILIERKRQ